ncbi:hypothetical protein PoB_006098700 [Plakobranchus ocellatus]|uniref:Uncharacterized protein n=1 Tax=Plakobranchus ocellatus TaxID=259542 RepID=A0AAV4CRH7_9GAST|nr:hypothetical protein PoB_006098700 [Plakobranchus ocellatus]
MSPTPHHISLTSATRSSQSKKIIIIIIIIMSSTTSSTSTTITTKEVCLTSFVSITNTASIFYDLKVMAPTELGRVRKMTLKPQRS